MSKKFNNRGFTLVEVVVSLTLLIVVIALTCTIILTVFNHYSNDSSVTRAKTLGDTAAQWLTDQLRYATELEITDDQSVNTYDTAIEVRDGNIFYWKTDAATAPKNLYGEDFYGNMTVETTAAVTEDRILTVTLMVKDHAGKTAYTKENTYEIINMTVAQREGDLDINGTVDENTVKVNVADDLAPGKTWTNPVFCFNSDLVVTRGDYFPAPQDMYNQCLYAMELFRENSNLLPNYGSNYLSNEAVRNYLYVEYYSQEWPLITSFVDVDLVSAPTGVKNKKPLNERLIAVQPHVFPGSRNAETGLTTDPNVVIYGRDIGTAAGNNAVSTWNNIVIVFVPDRYSNQSVDMSSGTWYTFLPTADHPTMCQTDQLTALGLLTRDDNIAGFYDTVKAGWHPVDGRECTCNCPGCPCNQPTQ